MGHNVEAPESEAQKWKRKLLKFKYNKPNLDQYYPKEEDLRQNIHDGDVYTEPALQEGQTDIPKIEG